MTDESNNQQSTSDDAELAKVLAGISKDVDGAVPTDTPQAPTSSDAPAVDTEETPATTEPSLTPEPQIYPEQPANTAPTATAHSQATSSAGSELDSIKLEALKELRPLVDKLNVSAEEKFDTYLLLLRSTDDKELIGPAHDAAKSITDEARRAQALLDIIKEIDFLSQTNKSAA